MRLLHLSTTLLALLACPLAAQQLAADPLQGFPKSSGAAMVLSDVDGDGQPDLVLGVSGGQNKLFLNDGHGAFTDASTRLPTDKDTTLAVAVADVDKDGDQDIAFGNYGGQNRLLLQGTNGTFTDATSGNLPSSTDSTQSLTFFDADGDGDADLVVGNQNEVNTLLLNDGKGKFSDVSAKQMPSDQNNTQTIVAADMDGDKDFDLVVGDTYGGNHLLLNDGKGSFAKAPTTNFPYSGKDTYALAVGDINGDGRLDVVFAYGRTANDLYVNQGSGKFTIDAKAIPTTTNTASFGVALADIDEDGDLDMVVANSFAQNELLLNDGKGKFTDATTRLPKITNATGAVLLGDVDQDGDQDLVFGNGGPELLSNHLRQLSTSGTLQINQGFGIVLYRHRGFQASTGIAVTGVSVGPRIPAVPVPGLGRLLVNPGPLVLLPSIDLPSTTGSATIQGTVPNDSSLKNVRLSFQAVVARKQPPGFDHLTNAASAVIQ